MNKRIVRLLALAAIFGLAGVATAQKAEHEDDHQAMHVSGELDLQFPDTGKWASDESLRQGMSELKAAFEPAHEAYRNDAFGAGKADELADAVDEQVNFMFANCQLPAEADAELHKLLAAALGAARLLRASNDLHEGLHQLHRVLQAYPDYFEHPGWPG